jgi:hypothetical protein
MLGKVFLCKEYFMENRLSQKRKGIRYRSHALVSIPDAVEEHALLRDISVSGCRIEYEKQVDLKLHNMYILHVFPETNSKLEKFELLVESRWNRLKNNACEVGFKIISAPVLFSQYRHWCLKPN